MHIEPGVVDGAKILLSHATGAGVGAYTLKLAFDTIRSRGPVSLVFRTVLSTVAVFSFFEVFPHFPVGVSEVHFILGSTLFLLLGAAPAAIGLALGLLIQGLFFAPADLPQYGMNITTLLVPLFVLRMLARRIIAPDTPYVDLKYRQALALSVAYQSGIVAWVSFWAFYGEGLAAWQGIAAFAGAYMMVVLIEPLADLAVLAAAKAVRGRIGSGFFARRLFAVA